jgi:hypothetical protein
VKHCVSLSVGLAVVVLIGHLASAAELASNPDAGRIASDDGRVGIGTGKPAATLDVYKGEIKIGSSGAACTKELAGMIRYADDQLQVCNSRGWQLLATDAQKK